MSRRAKNNATTWLLTIFDSDLKSPQKLIAAYLRTHMNDYQEMAWPSVGRIAAKTGLCERSVQGHLKSLCQSGWLLNNGKSDLGTIRYAIAIPPQEMHPRSKCTPQEIPNTPAGDAPELTKEINNICAEQKTKRTTKKFVPPTLDEVKAHWQEKGWPPSEAIAFFEYFSEGDWRDSRGKKVSAWKRNAATWNNNNFGGRIPSRQPQNMRQGIDYV